MRLQDLARLGVVEVDAELAQNPHRGLVDSRNSLGAEQFIDWQVIGDLGRLVNCSGSRPRPAVATALGCITHRRSPLTKNREQRTKDRAGICSLSFVLCSSRS